MKKYNLIITYLVLIILICKQVKADQQSNFNIMPSPISYPYFIPDRYDLKIDGSLISIS